MVAAAVNATPLTTKAGFLHAFRRFDQYQTLGAITAKTVVISGGADLLTPVAHARDLVAGIPGARLVHRPAAGHMLLHETPHAVTDAIDSVVGLRRRPAPVSGARRQAFARRSGTPAAVLVAPARPHQPSPVG